MFLSSLLDKLVIDVFQNNHNVVMGTVKGISIARYLHACKNS